MQLKSVELYGFKSFADKTFLNFGEGITGIVGPNGCGKTNITDAIKWVLGEQSAKSLRGSKMEDVIFNGTTSRKATSLSEITLTFDNSKNVLPIDYSEVSVTRRLYRSGESEYLLNKTPVRLKDIRSLFLDTGIGTSSYSIMEQGKIDFILQSKPEERRNIFEEVAGVSKYKVKREEALRKLERVGQDMLRLNDILSELESQKSKLDSQARKAKQYQKYLNELKTYEINSLVKKYFEIKDLNTAKTKELEAVNEKNLQISVKIDEVDANYSKVKINLTAKEDELIAKRTEANRIDSSIQLLKERISLAETGKTELLERNQEAQNEIQQGETDLNNYSNEHKDITRRLEEYESVVASSNEVLSKKTEEKNKLESEISELAKEIESAREEIFSIATTTTELNNKILNDEHLLSELNQRIEKTRVQKEETTAQKDEKEKNLNELKTEIQGIQKLLEEKSKEGTEQNEKKLQLNRTIEQLQNRLFEKKNTLAQINARLESLTGSSNYELNQKIKQTFPDKIYGTVSELISVRDTADMHILQSALGEKSDYLICDTPQTAFEVIDWLKNTREMNGWASFLVLSDIEKIGISQPGVFSGKLLTELIDCKPEFRKTVEFLLANAVLQKENIHIPGIIQGGKKTGVKKGGLEITNDIKNLKKEIETVNDGISETESLLQNSQKEIADIESWLKDNSETIETCKNNLLISSKNLATLEESLKTSGNFLQLLANEHEEFLKQKAFRENTVSQNKQILSRKSERETTAKTRLSEMLAHNQKCQDSIKNISGEITRMTVDFSVKNSQLSHLKDNLKNISGNMESAGIKIEKAKKWLTGSGTKLSEFEKTLKNSAEEINRITVSKDSMDDVVKSVEKARDEIKNEILDIENTLRELRISQQKIQDEMRGIDRSVSATASEIRQIENRIREEKEIAFEDAVNNYQEITLTQDSVEKLKKKIEALGAVNLAAPEEYEQLEQRYNFLFRQKTDLEKAREDLHSAINKINMTTRQNFHKTFMIVQDNFRKIFTQLFEGGEADLLLTDESNLLETGVDVIAQPPGKKLQHISLLSGGERGLTAIALLFAIYLVKPAPFCILDEIDGPLDDANVLRFTRMLKEFAKTSQFFVITHNKRTMEAANILYGITMEELGVSKTISVKLEGEKVGIS
ncbi:MAG: AAA family ATPase [Elusimicrobia bacterium]|nr:AAA family ATPase [Elusimicrobiota bacterium]